MKSRVDEDSKVNVHKSLEHGIGNPENWKEDIKGQEKKRYKRKCIKESREKVTQLEKKST